MKRETPVEILAVGGGIGYPLARRWRSRAGAIVQVLAGRPGVRRDRRRHRAGAERDAHARSARGPARGDRLLGAPPLAGLFMDAVKGEPLTSVDLGADFLGHYGTPYVVLHRSDLHSILLDRRIALAVDKLVVRVEDGPTARSPSARMGPKRLRGADRRRRPAVGAADQRRRRTASGQRPHLDRRRGPPPAPGTAWVTGGVSPWRHKVRRGELYNQVGGCPGAAWRIPRARSSAPPAELDADVGRCCPAVRRGAGCCNAGCGGR